MEHRELHRLISAAIVNQHFRCQLLENPLEAISMGYLGQSFSLTREEQELLASIRAGDFPTFSQHIHQWISRNGHQGQSGQFRDIEES